MSRRPLGCCWAACPFFQKAQLRERASEPPDHGITAEVLGYPPCYLLYTRRKAEGAGGHGAHEKTNGSAKATHCFSAWEASSEAGEKQLHPVTYPTPLSPVPLLLCPTPGKGGSKGTAWGGQSNTSLAPAVGGIKKNYPDCKQSGNSCLQLLLGIENETLYSNLTLKELITNCP